MRTRGIVGAALLVALGLVLLLAFGPTSVRERAQARGDAATRSAAAAGPEMPEAKDADVSGDGSSPAGADDGPPRSAEIEGTVTGRYGGLWGATVVVLDAAGGDEIARTTTKPGGTYRIVLDPAPGAVRVVVRPDPATELVEHAQELALAAGDSRTLDVALGDGLEVHGVVVDGRGEPIGRLRVVAVPLDSYREAVGDGMLTPALLARVRKETARATDGSFEIRGLRPGKYRLVLDDESWLLDPPVLFDTGDGDLGEVRAAPARTIGLRVVDEDGQPIERFEAVVRLADGRELVRLDGRAGRIDARVALPEDVLQAARPYRGPVPWRYLPAQVEGTIEIRAARRETATCDLGARGVVVLVRSREPDFTLRVTYEDGAPYPHDIRVLLRRPAKDLDWVVASTRVGAGVHRIAVPAGPSRLHVSPARTLFSRDEATVDVEGGAGGEATVVLRRGGTWVVHGPPARPVAVSRDGTSLGRIARTLDGTYHDVPPGTYELAVWEQVEDGGTVMGAKPGTVYRWTVVRRVVVEPGSYEEIDLR